MDRSTDYPLTRHPFKRDISRDHTRSTDRTHENMAGVGDVFDVCVIGAGVEGSSTARYLASRGKKTLLLEQVRVIVLVVYFTT